MHFTYREINIIGLVALFSCPIMTVIAYVLLLNQAHKWHSYLCMYYCIHILTQFYSVYRLKDLMLFLV